jgi:uncharacterized protein YjlB
MPPKIETHRLSEDALVPNNPAVATRIYRAALPTGPGAEKKIAAHFARNGWSNSWVNGIYSHHHYHATVHEVLGVARGSARVQLGGPSGPVVDLAPGDCVLIPAGVGHCCLAASRDLSVVGAYPEGADWDLVRATPEARAAAVVEIGRVPMPRSDPALGGAFQAS